MIPELRGWVKRILSSGPVWSSQWDTRKKKEVKYHFLLREVSQCPLVWIRCPSLKTRNLLSPWLWAIVDFLCLSRKRPWIQKALVSCSHRIPKWPHIGCLLRFEEQVKFQTQNVNIGNMAAVDCVARQCLRQTPTHTFLCGSLLSNPTSGKDGSETGGRPYASGVIKGLWLIMPTQVTWYSRHLHVTT